LNVVRVIVPDRKAESFEMLALVKSCEVSAPETAAPHVDVILSTDCSKVSRQPKQYGSAQSKAIRDLFRSLGWSKFFRVTKGGYSLGVSIEWAKGMTPSWSCEAWKKHREANAMFGRTYGCGCETCRLRVAQRDAIGRRVHYVLNLAFGGEREYGDRSDSMTDYFDADYTFHA
jgi:hypothetical protein